MVMLKALGKLNVSQYKQKHKNVRKKLIRKREMGGGWQDVGNAGVTRVTRIHYAHVQN